MQKVALATVLIASAFYSGLGVSSGRAGDLVWEVESPFRFFKKTSSYEVQERAFSAVRGDPNGPLPSNIVWRLERRLNDPDCRDRSSPTACAETARAHYEASRLGWASQTVEVNCYDRNVRPRRYSTVCARQYSWGVAKEDYILPDAHTVIVRLATDDLAKAGNGECTWSWQPRRAGGKAETQRQACKNKLVIKRVPFSLDRKVSGVSVKVQLPDGREIADPNVVVEDLFLVAIGDSFASGESNPDRPVTFSAAREMVYDPVNADTREQMAQQQPTNQFGLASADPVIDPKRLPKRLMEDEQRGLIYQPNTPEFLAAFNKSSAHWLSADCHRSQYGYPFRVGIELTLENRHRAVTFVSLACSGSDVVEGLFLERDARERFSEKGGAKAPSQFDMLSDLICRNGSAGRTRSASYTLPVYSWGSKQISSRTIAKHWCPPESRKRAIDLVMLSIGGNDIGFGALALYSMTDSAGDLAPIAGWVGSQIRFGPDVSRAYLGVLDERIKAVKSALVDGFGIDPSRVLQNAYEPIQFDETGGLCGLQPTLGMDVHPNLKVSRARIKDASDVAHELQTRLECIAGSRRNGCPAGLATGSGTGFQLITDHLAEFAKRGICARDPKHALADQMAMGMPRLSQQTGEFEPYSPAATLPYGHRWRLIHNPNDAFLAGNTHREGISQFDILQPAYAALYSGAFHPTAEGHAIVADHVMRHVRAILDQRERVVDSRPN